MYNVCMYFQEKVIISLFMLTILSLAYHSHISLLLISVLRSYLYNAIIHDDEDDAVDMMKGNREWNEV